MGSLYAIVSLVGLGFIGLAFLVFALEGGKEQRYFLAAFGVTMLIAGYVLYEAVFAFLHSAN